MISNSPAKGSQVPVDDVNHPSINSLWAYHHLSNVSPSTGPQHYAPSLTSVEVVEPSSHELLTQQSSSRADHRAHCIHNLTSSSSHDAPTKSELPINSPSKPLNDDIVEHDASKAHSGLKLFKCMLDPLCTMEFTRAEHLARHERKHTKEKPFLCHCGKSFSRLDNWRQHKISVHKDDTEQNASTEIRLVQVHKAMQRDNNIRRAATIAAQRKQEQSTLPSTSNPLPPLVGSISNDQNLFRQSSHHENLGSLSDSPFVSYNYIEPNHSIPNVFSPTFGVLPALYTSTPPLPELYGQDPPYALANSAPYSMSDSTPVATSPSYNSCSTGSCIPLSTTGPYAAEMEINRVLCYPNLSNRATAYTSACTSKAYYPNGLMEPFTGTTHVPPTIPHHPGPLQPIQPSQAVYNSSAPPSLLAGAHTQVLGLGKGYREGSSAYLPLSPTFNQNQLNFSSSNSPPLRTPQLPLPEITSSSLFTPYQDVGTSFVISTAPTRNQLTSMSMNLYEKLEQVQNENEPSDNQKIQTISTLVPFQTHDSIKSERNELNSNEILLNISSHNRTRPPLASKNDFDEEVKPFLLNSNFKSKSDNIELEPSRLKRAAVVKPDVRSFSMNKKKKQKTIR
ncbi:hypothetical protein CROQUDRAFT_672888 [Cronartium quercuum f. sp. fusiforme G11]|uniref:C2H2-type domain-containing protein n=1 Tax=Cronartium quercuum f. sp. fusiforme G11 TaxID=708437 RepID=A0A9P6T8W7_9BASI|nr:hypothetical protein CROQUDRAFT_672888 [Cronartium quercuum f. sp. fusiforme G11]